MNQDNQQWLRERYTPAPKRKRSGWNIAAAAIGILVGLLFIIGLAGAIGGSSKPAPKSGGVAGLPVPTSSPIVAGAEQGAVVSWAPVPTAEPTSGITDGTYEVGAQIAPGKYTTAGGTDCYWARLKSETESDIIANHFGDGPTTVVVKPSDKYFHTQGCEGWVRVSG